MKLISQNEIIPIFQKLGFKTKESGTCHGLTLCWIQSFLVGEEAKYFDRINYLADVVTQGLPGDTYRARVKKIYLNQKLKISITDESSDENEKIKKELVKKSARIYDEILSKNQIEYVDNLNIILDEIKTKKGNNLNNREGEAINLLAFGNNIELLQQAIQYDQTSLFGIGQSGRRLTQNDPVPISVVTQSELLESSGGLHQVFARPYLGNDDELTQYFDILMKLLANTSNQGVNTPMSLSSNNHTIGLRYDSINDSWLLMNPNALPYKNVSKENIVSELKDAFQQSEAKILGFDLRMFTSDNKFSLLSEIYQSHPVSNLFHGFSQLHSVTATSALKISDTGTTQLSFAARAGYHDMVESLLKFKSPIIPCGEEGEYPQHQAASHGQIEVLKLFMLNNVDLNVKAKTGRTPFCCSIIDAQPEVIRLLVDNKFANPNEDLVIDQVIGSIKKPLAFALIREHWSIAEMLVEYGASITINDLFKVIKDGNETIARCLISKCDPALIKQHHTSKYGDTLLSTAIEHNKSEIVMILLEAGCDPRGKVDHLEPFSLSLKHVNVKSAELLMKYLSSAEVSEMIRTNASSYHSLSSSDPKDTVLEAAIKLDANDLLHVIIPELSWNTDDAIQAVKFELLKNIFKELSDPDALTRSLSYELVKAIRIFTSDNLSELKDTIVKIIDTIPQKNGLFQTHPFDNLSKVIERKQGSILDITITRNIF